MDLPALANGLVGKSLAEIFKVSSSLLKKSLHAQRDLSTQRLFQQAASLNCVRLWLEVPVMVSGVCFSEPG